METGIHIGNKIDANESAPAITAAVVEVLEAIDEHRIDREVAIKALEVVQMSVGQGNPVTISNCHIDGSATITPSHITEGVPE